MRTEHAIILAAIIVLSSCQQDTPLAEYAPSSAQEQELKAVLLEFQAAVVTKDPPRLLKLIHENASLMIGADRKIFSKAAYAVALPGRLAESATIFLGTPKMAVAGDSAEIKIYMDRGAGRFLMVFNMIRVSGRWLIIGWEY